MIGAEMEMDKVAEIADIAWATWEMGRRLQVADKKMAEALRRLEMGTMYGMAGRVVADKVAEEWAERCDVVARRGGHEVRSARSVGAVWEERAEDWKGQAAVWEERAEG